MKNFFHKYRLYVSIAAYLLSVVAIAYFGIQTLVNMINENANSYQKRLVDEESRKKRLNDLPKLKEQYEMIGQEGGRVDLFLNKDATIDLIKRIEEIGNQTENKVTIQIDEKVSNFGTDEKKAQKKDSKKNNEELLLDQFSGFKYLDVKLAVEGKYNTIANFIKKIENIEYHADILAVSLKKSENKANVNYSSGSLFDGATSSENTSQPEKPRDPDMLDGNIEVIFYLK